MLYFCEVEAATCVPELCLQRSWQTHSLNNFLSLAAANQEAGVERHRVLTIDSSEGLLLRINSSGWQCEKKQATKKKQKKTETHLEVAGQIK